MIRAEALSVENQTNSDKSRPEPPVAEMGTLVLVGIKHNVNCPAMQMHKSYLRKRERFERNGMFFSKHFNNSEVRLFLNIPNVEAHLFQVVPEKHI